MKSDIDNTAVVCAVRNRNEILENSLRNWIRFSVPEIVLVDFRDESCEPVREIVLRLGDPRIRLIETVHEYHFQRTVALNLGVSQVEAPFFLKLDADYVLRPGFFEANAVDEESFLSGSEIPDEYFLTGLLYVSKNNFDRSGGYHERLFYYGREDKDIEERLGAFLTLKKARDRSVVHKPHSDDLRLAGVGRFARNDEYPVLQTQMALNRLIAEGNRWDEHSTKVQWTLERTHGNIVVAKRRFD